MVDNKAKDSSLKSFFNGINIKDAMNTSVVKVSEEARLSAAQLAFIRHKVNHLIIVDDRNRVVGIISQKYLYRAHSPRKLIAFQPQYDPDMIVDGDSYFSKQALDGYILKHVMNKNPFVLHTGDTLATALTYMARKRLGFIPVVDEIQRPIGTITDQEIIGFIARLL